jgi:hypothetical protein
MSLAGMLDAREALRQQPVKQIRSPNDGIFFVITCVLVLPHIPTLPASAFFHFFLFSLDACDMFGMTTVTRSSCSAIMF